MVRILFAILLTGSLAVVYAEDDVQGLLDKMHQALETDSYQGTFVLMHREGVETIQIVHGHSSSGGVKGKLVLLTGDAREVIRDQDVLTCIWPKDKLVVVETARTRHGLPSSFFPGNVNKLALHYKITEVGHSRIAGFNCKVMRFEPLDKFRYGHELCVSPAGMLLASKTFDADDKVIEKMMFTSFRVLQSVPDALFEPSVQLSDYTWRTADMELNGKLQPDQAWKIQNLPPGFSLSSVTKRLMSASKKPVQHIVLSDGLVSVSVFISKDNRPQHTYHGTRNKGVINAYTRGLDQHRITVVGEVPEGTVKMIGLSIFYSRP